MKTTIRFAHVSKKYQLGLSRTSLPSVVSGWVKRSLKRPPLERLEERIFWALRDVNFEVKQGESLALVGANGAGKTTILKLLAHITKPTAGKIYAQGKLSALIELGAGFHPDLTGRENIYLNGSILGLNRTMIANHFDEIVAFSELERFIDTPVKRYSSGMVIRLGFAVASCMQPDILLVDEVLAVGDAAFQQKCLKRIHSLIDNGTSIIFVSHNFYLIQAVCNTALYLQRGQVKEYSTTEDVLSLYEQDLHEERARKFERAQPDADAGDDDIHITQVEVLRGDGSPTEVFYSDQPAQIQIHYQAYKPLGKIHVSVFIIRSDGLTCCMMRSKLDLVELFVDQGYSTISLHLEPLQLVGGTYFAEAWFLNDSDSMTINSQAGRSDWFTVKGQALSYGESNGIFEPHTRWEHQQALVQSVYLSPTCTFHPHAKSEGR
jgi:lipopolysaccharide transport system ATP-binding protein